MSGTDDDLIQYYQAAATGHAPTRPIQPQPVAATTMPTDPPASQPTTTPSVLTGPVVTPTRGSQPGHDSTLVLAAQLADRLRPRRRIPGLWYVKLAAVLVVFALLIRLALSALGGIGFHVAWNWPFGHPHVPAVVKTVTTDNLIGAAILQQVETVDRPALGQANYAFDFKRQVSKNIGFWPCWFSMSFHAEARAWAYVDLNPGAAWWAPDTGHYLRQVQGHNVSINLVLPLPTISPTVHDVAIDNTLSQTLATDHSWTYPGFGCGALLKPQFASGTMYGVAQQVAFYLATGKPVAIDGVHLLNTSNATTGQIQQQLVASAEAEARSLYLNDFIGPTVASFGDHLVSLVIHWVPA